MNTQAAWQPLEKAGAGFVSTHPCMMSKGFKMKGYHSHHEAKSTFVCHGLLQSCGYVSFHNYKASIWSYAILAFCYASYNHSSLLPPS